MSATAHAGRGAAHRGTAAEGAAAARRILCRRHRRRSRASRGFLTPASAIAPLCDAAAAGRGDHQGRGRRAGHGGRRQADAGQGGARCVGPAVRSPQEETCGARPPGLATGDARRGRTGLIASTSPPTARPTMSICAASPRVSRLFAACRRRSTHTLEQLPIPKVMSYAGAGGYYNDVKFVRPAHRLLALHGADVVPVTALGLAADRLTGGHRFQSRDGIRGRDRGRLRGNAARRGQGDRRVRRAPRRDRRRARAAPPRARRSSCRMRCSTK